jgi:hypothetical protein
MAAAVAGAAVVTCARAAPAQDDAGAAAAPPGAVMTCDRADAPGRVRCEVEARVGPEETISWGDVVLVGTPPFVAALRGRIGPDDATAREGQYWRWALALALKQRGSGNVDAQVRLVVCRGERCAPRVLPVRGLVVAAPTDRHSVQCHQPDWVTNLPRGLGM